LTNSGLDFIHAEEAQQKSILDQMAFTIEGVEEQPQEVQFLL
jgi:hypothetical protein